MIPFSRVILLKNCNLLLDDGQYIAIFFWSYCSQLNTFYIIRVHSLSLELFLVETPWPNQLNFVHYASVYFSHSSTQQRRGVPPAFRRELEFIQVGCSNHSVLVPCIGYDSSLERTCCRYCSFMLCLVPIF